MVKVNTEEKKDGNVSIDTVMESDMELFSKDEKITYTKKPKAQSD